MLHKNDDSTSEMRQTAVLIIGMHRSGTSLLANFVQALGIPVGRKLVPADIHNPAGYFEDRDCVDIQERILQALNKPWNGESGMLPFPHGWWRNSEIQPLVEELDRWIGQRVTDAPIWAVKDPRTTRLLPLWQELLQRRGVTIRYLLAIRHPSAVTASVVARDKVPAERVHATWLRYNSEAILHTGDQLNGIFDYSQWFGLGSNQLNRLALALGIHLSHNEIAEIYSNIIRNDLQRQGEDSYHAPAWSQEFYYRLRKLTEELSSHKLLRLAAESEYLDAMLRQGHLPDLCGDLEIVCTSQERFKDAEELALSLRSQGKRVALAASAPFSVDPSTRVAALSFQYDGPQLDGPYGHHARDAYILWGWLRKRGYLAIHVEGGYGFAAHLLDARRQGISDASGPVNIYYSHLPKWIRNDGLLHLKNIADVEALYLERRILENPQSLVHAPAHILAVLRTIVGTTQAPPRSISVQSSRPLVSICITHYNRPDLLDRCLSSVGAQTYDNFEVVLVDDGSTQPAAKMFLESIQPTFDARGWKLIRQENGYLGSARNTAVRAARGDFIFFLDDDNLLLKDGVERALKVAHYTGADIVTAVMFMFDGHRDDRPTYPEKIGVQMGSVPLLGIFENNFGDANALIRRSCWDDLEGFTEDRNLGAEDWELFAKALLKGWRLEYSLEPFSWYRVAANSMSRSGDWWGDYRRALRPFEAQLPIALRELPAIAGMLMRRIIELEHVEDKISVLRKENAGLGASVAEAQWHYAESEDKLKHTSAHLAQVLDQLSVANERLIQAKRVENDLESQLHQKEIVLTDYATRLDESIKHYETRLREASNQAELSFRFYAELQAVYTSTSWRITRPLRAIKKVVLWLRRTPR